MDNKLTLRITPSAAEWLERMGNELHIVPTTFHTRLGDIPVGNIRPGAPEENTATDYTALTDSGYTVWAPADEAYVKNEVLIDLAPVPGMPLPMPLAVSIILIPEDSGCGGDCSGCSHCTSCGSRHDDELL